MNRILTVLMAAMLLPFAVSAQSGVQNLEYQMPPDEVAAIVDAPATPGVSLSPTRE